MNLKISKINSYKCKKVNDFCHSLDINPSTSNVGFTPVPRYLSYMYFS